MWWILIGIMFAFVYMAGCKNGMVNPFLMCGILLLWPLYLLYILWKVGRTS